MFGDWAGEAVDLFVVESWGEELLKWGDICVYSGGVDEKVVEGPNLIGGDDSVIAIVGWVMNFYDFFLD